MEILSPQLQWIGGRCYRVNPTREEPGAAFNNNVDQLELDVPSQYIEEGIFYQNI